MTAKWPAARISVLIFVGVTAIYLIGRWEAQLSAGEREHQHRVENILEMGKAFRVSRDSLRTIGDSLARLDTALTRAENRATILLGQLAQTDTLEADSLASTPLASLLPSLRLLPIRAPTGTVRFVTDSTGVRFLADRMLRLVQAERRVGVLGDLATTRARRIAALGGQLRVAHLRADSAETRVVDLEKLLGESDRLRRRKGKFLGFLPKPSPLLTFVAGALVCKLVCPGG